MFSRIAVVALGFFATVEASSINQENGNIAAGTDAAKNIMQHARRVDEYDGQYGDVDSSFLVGYNVKFQGCHHVQQWNEDAEDEEDVRIMTKRLVRFRLCPSGSCLTDLSGCSSHYGDYVVDMETYMTSFYEAAAENGGQDMSDYTACNQFDMRRHLDENGENGYYDEAVDYYLGPYCASQGGEIRLGLFTDDTCTSYAESQDAIQGMPYATSSMVSTSCVSCSAYGDDGYETSSFCEDIYEISGKCESKMDVGYPNESACNYIDGIKVIRYDGGVGRDEPEFSKTAAVATGCFLTVAVLLAGYVYYLRTKLGRAKINLNAASQSLA